MYVILKWRERMYVNGIKCSEREQEREMQNEKVCNDIKCSEREQEREMQNEKVSE